MRNDVCFSFLICTRTVLIASAMERNRDIMVLGQHERSNRGGGVTRRQTLSRKIDFK